MKKDDNQTRTLAQYQESHSLLAKTLTEIGYIWPGTVQKQMLTCGKSNCSCHRDLEARHGPYWYWTSKRKGKTVSKKLTPEEAEIISEWIENRRRIERILKEMAQLSARALPLLLNAPSHQKR